MEMESNLSSRQETLRTDQMDLKKITQRIGETVG